MALAMVLGVTAACHPAAGTSANEPHRVIAMQTDWNFIDVSQVFGAQDQRERIAERFADAASRDFLRHAARGDLQAMTALVRGGYAVDTPGRDGATPLMVYVSHVRPVRRDVLVHMIALGADVTRPLPNRMALLNGLARVRDPAMLATLLQAGVSPDTRLPAIGETWLTVALREQHTALALSLLAAGADPELHGGSPGGTPWRTAIALGNWAVAEALLRAGVDPRAGDPDLRRLAHALGAPVPAGDAAQHRGHATVAAWLAAQDLAHGRAQGPR